MKIKKYKINISSEESQSNYVVDLRSPRKDFFRESKKKTNELINNSNSFIGENKSISNNFIPKKNKVKIKNPINTNKLKNTFFYPVFLILFKFFVAIIMFFVDWIVDIFIFFKKIFKKRKLELVKVEQNIEKEIKEEFKRELKNTEKGILLIEKEVEKDVDFIEKKINKAIHNRKITSIDFSISNFYNKKKKKSILFFVMFLFILIFPFKLYSYYKLAFDKDSQDRIVSNSFSALDNFKLASSKMVDMDMISAQENFIQAGQKFLILDQELKKIDELVLFLASFSGDDKIRLASESKNISKIGIHLSSVGDNFSIALNSLILAFSDEQGKMNNHLDDFYYYGKKAKKDFSNLNKNLKKIKNSSLPSEFENDFIEIKKQVDLVEKNLSYFLDIFPSIQDFLGLYSDKRYLIVFQNNAEMRASGGFIGSYALLDFKKGEIINIEIPSGGSYDTEGGMRVLMESPKPLHLLKSIWYFWDANWWPDWKLSAQNLMWFYDKSGGPSVDGVIAITPDLLADILDLSGPIDLSDKYGVIIDSNNFGDIIQEIVEVIGQPELYQDKNLKTNILEKTASSTSEDDNKILSNLDEELIADSELFLRNEPKKIINDLMIEISSVFLEKMNKELLLKSLIILEKNLSKKNILIYSNNQQIQDELEKRSWAGRIKNPPLDYLMLVNTNIGGGKTDKVIENNIKLNVNIQNDGSIINKLSVKRKHLGSKSDLFSGVRNVNWLRVYVPLGSTLINASGFSQPDKNYFKASESFYEKNELLEISENKAEIDLLSGTKIYQESDKTVFANWAMIDPGQEDLIEIEYKLAQNFHSLFEENKVYKKLFLNFWQKEILKSYSILIQKQAGSNDHSFDLDINFDFNIETLWSYPEAEKIEDNLFKFSGKLDSDKYSVIILK